MFNKHMLRDMYYETFGTRRNYRPSAEDQRINQLTSLIETLQRTAHRDPRIRLQLIAAKREIANLQRLN